MKVWLGRPFCVFVGLALMISSAVAGQTRYREVQQHMGAKFEIVLYASSERKAQRAFAAAFQRAADLDRAMSDYDPASELSRLSRASPTRHPLPLSEDLFNVLELATAISQSSGGAFDVTVGPLTRLWRRAHRQRAFPAADRLERALQAVGYRHLVVDPKQKTASLMRPGMWLDLGGIAKGYAAQQMLATLGDHGVDQALVNSGGDITVSKPPPSADGWRIAVMPLGGNDDELTFVLLSNRAVATSGDAWQFVEIEGKRYSHIVDPRTGIGTTRSGGVTVIAPDGALSDALASALSVMEVEAGIELVERFPGASARIVWINGEDRLVRSSSGFPELLGEQLDR